jgi:hypothetical protein
VRAVSSLPRSLAPLLTACLVLPGCADVVVGYFSGTEGSSAAGSSAAGSSAAGSSAAGTTALDGTGSGVATGETTGSGFVPPGCFSDDFEDGVVDEPLWNAWAEEDSRIEELAGQLELTPPSYGLFDTGLVGRFDHHFVFESGWVRLQVVAPPTVDRPVALFLMVADAPENLSISVGGGELRVAGSLDEAVVFQQSFPSTPYPRWLGIRGEGPLAHFEISEDGDTWTTLATYDKPGPFDDAAALIMAQTFGDDAAQGVVSVDDLEVCLQ